MISGAKNTRRAKEAMNGNGRRREAARGRWEGGSGSGRTKENPKSSGKRQKVRGGKAMVYNGRGQGGLRTRRSRGGKVAGGEHEEMRVKSRRRYRKQAMMRRA